METSPITFRSLVMSFCFGLIVLFIIFLKNTFDKSTKIIFCDVGQGDAIYLRIRNKIDIIIDAGSNRDVLNCLGKYMPFFDRKIEIAILTHYQKDHYGGFVEILDRYKIDKFLTLRFKREDLKSQSLLNKLKLKNVQVYYPTTKTKLSILDGEIKFLWPNEEKYTTADNNDNSLIFQYKEKNYKILFTGDTTKSVLNKLVEQINNHKANFDWRKTNVLKIPHHGSKNGLMFEFLKLADPSFSVISVGKKNSYGHPSSEVLEMLNKLKKKYLRTDTNGDIIFKIP